VPIRLETGEAVEVVIATLEVDEGDLILEFLRREEDTSTANNAAAIDAVS
jgi:hypothetical protein